MLLKKKSFNLGTNFFCWCFWGTKCSKIPLDQMWRRLLSDGRHLTGCLVILWWEIFSLRHRMNKTFTLMCSDIGLKVLGGFIPCVLHFVWFCSLVPVLPLITSVVDSFLSYLRSVAVLHPPLLSWSLFSSCVASCSLWGGRAGQKVCVEPWKSKCWIHCADDALTKTDIVSLVVCREEELCPSVSV